MKTTLSVIGKIANLRMAAATIYDRGTAAGLDPLKVAEDVKPFTVALHDTIRKSVHSDLAGTILAIEYLENQAAAHKRDAAFLLNKAEDALHHARQIREAIIKDLKARDLTERLDGDFSATLVEIDGREHLTLR